jgi:S-formylglutathione hydrolase
MALELVSSSKSFGGVVRKYAHLSSSTQTRMQWNVYLPSAALASPAAAQVPVVYWLSGLTCTEDNMMHKAGAPHVAERLGVALVCPDTSPRGLALPGEHDAYDFGSGAGFYVDARRAPWDQHYRMFTYVTEELPALVEAHLPVIAGRRAVMGHSMGGHGALIAALKCPGKYASVSAFAPIAHPSACAWGRKAFAGYLGDDERVWQVR